jgi:hypothetical protein
MACLRHFAASVFSTMATGAERYEIGERARPCTAWWTESRSVAWQRTQRLPSRTRAGRLSFCQAKRLSSGREEPERRGVVHRVQRPKNPSGVRSQE